MSDESPRIAILTESPDDCPRTWPSIEYLMEPIEQEYEMDRLHILPGEPRNGKSATKTELKGAPAIDWGLYDFVMLVGNTPLQYVTGKAGIKQARGKPFKRGRTTFLPVNNPSVIKHDENQEVLTNNDLQLFFNIVEFGGVPEERNLNIRIVQDEDDFREMLDDLSGTVSFDVETNSLNPFQEYEVKKNKKTGQLEFTKKPAEMKAIGFGTRRHQWILGFNMPDAPLEFDQVKEWMQEVAEKLEDCVTVAHNGKFDALWCWVQFGVRIRLDFDTMLSHFLLDENSRHGLKYLAQVLLGAPDWEVDLDTKQGASSFLKLSKYLAHDLYYTRELRFKLGKMMNKEPSVKDVFKHIMMPSANLFTEIEYDGVYIDMDQFDSAELALRERYEESLSKLKQWEPADLVDKRGRPVPFNWGSPTQLANLLFDRLRIPVVEKTKAGGRSTSESVLKRINHPMVIDLLAFREAKQQLSFFIDGWKPYLHKRHDGYYLHPSFKLHGTVTGRLSCENPNLQQVPRDKRIRSLISAPEGWVLIECDLSQIELRIAAELANERKMIHAFVNGIDVHWLTAISEISRGGGLRELVLDTASTWYQKKIADYSDAIDALLKMGPDEAVSINGEWKEYRKKAKAVNFGYLYGMWWKKFKDYARDSYGVNITDEQAQDSRESFFDNYPDLPDWHDNQRAFARRHGYVVTLSGRKRRLPDAMKRGNDHEVKMARQAAERQAINSPVQSFANDLNLMSALELRSEYGRNIVRICGTVHDAILLRVRVEYAEEVYNRLMEIMRGPAMLKTLGIRLSVPVEADGSIGPWGKGVTLKEWKEQCREKQESPRGRTSSGSAKARSRRTAGAGSRTTSSTSKSSARR